MFENLALGMTFKFTTSAAQILKEFGISNLPAGCKSKFALAIAAERKGNFEAAEKHFIAALEKEAEFRNSLAVA